MLPIIKITARLILSLALCFSAEALVAQTWSLRLQTEDSVRLDYHAQVAVGDGVVLAGRFLAPTPFPTDPSPMRHKNWVARLDGDGSVLWAKSLRAGLDHFPFGLATDDAGGIYLASLLTRPELPGVTSWIVKLSPSGGLVWSRNLDLDGRLIPFGIAATTGSVWIGANLSTPGEFLSGEQAVIIKLSENGVRRFAHTLSTPDEFRRRELAATADGGVVVGISPLQFDSPDDPNAPAFLVKHDAAGEVEWSRSITGRLGGIFGHQDGLISASFGANRTPFVVTLTSSGDVVRTTQFTSESFRGVSTHDIDGGPSNDLVFAFSSEGSAGPLHVVRIDPEHTPLWHVAFLPPTPFFEKWAVDHTASPTLAPRYATMIDPSRMTMLDANGQVGGNCDQFTHLPLTAEPFEPQIEPTDFAATPVGLAINHIDTHTEDLSLTPRFVCQPRPNLAVVEPPLFDLPREICINPDELLFPNGPFPRPPIGGEIGPAYEPSECHDVEICRRCLRRLDNGGETLPNPAFRAKAYAAARPFLTAAAEPFDLADLKALIRVLDAAPTGRFWTRNRKQTLAELSQLKTPAHIGSRVADALNRITLDQVLPKRMNRSVDQRVAKLGNLVSVETANASAVRMEIQPGGPDKLPGFKAGFPALSVSIEHRKPSPEPLAVSVYYGGLRFNAPTSRIRLLRYASGRYVDVTWYIDKSTQRIHGITDRGGIFLVASETE